MAAIRVEACTADDIRFSVLAKLGGLADADHALGKMVRLWRACTNRQTYVLEELIVAEVVPVDALVASGLGERVDGGIRIRGTKKRIEWLAKVRKGAVKGGAVNRARIRASREPQGYPSGSGGAQVYSPAVLRSASASARTPTESGEKDPSPGLGLLRHRGRRSRWRI